MRMVFKDRYRYYALLEDDTRGLVLQVGVGRVLLATMRVILSQEERERYEAEGKPFLDDLAKRVAAHPDAFRERAI